MANTEKNYTEACDGYHRAMEEKDIAELALSRANRELEVAKKAKEEAANLLKRSGDDEDEYDDNAPYNPDDDQDGDDDDDEDDVVLVEPDVAAKPPPRKKAKTAKAGDSGKKKQAKSKSKSTSTSRGVVKLLDIIEEKGMDPSKGGGRPARDEREFLRFYADFGKITKPKGAWKWDRNDPELELVRKAMDKFKSGMRQPSNFRKVTEWKEEEWAKYDL